MPVDQRDRILTTKDPTPIDAMLLQQFIMNLPCFSSVFRSMFGVQESLFVMAWIVSVFVV